MARFSPWSQQIADSIGSFGHDVHVLDFRHTHDDSLANPALEANRKDYARFASAGCRIHLVDAPVAGRLRHLWMARALRQLVQHEQADVVLTLYGGGLALAAYLSGVRPYCVYVVGSDVLTVGRVGRRINCQTFTRAARVFANGEYLSRRAQEQAPHAAVTSLLIGVDRTQFQQTSPPHEFVQIICTRGFQPVYNNEAIIRAIARIPDDAGNFRVVFTSGGGTLAACRELADRIVPAGGRSRLCFLGGVSHSRLREELARSHAIISVSRSDGTATSVLEGMASGLYPILSDIPQNRALIRPGESIGTLVPLDDEAALVNALVDVARHAAVRVDAARQNRQFIAARADGRVNRRILASELEAVAQRSRCS